MDREPKSSLGAGRPAWIKAKAPSGEEFEEVMGLVTNLQLHTVCQSARCPNIGECWRERTATFLILGNTCTRSCRFCAVPSGQPLPPDENEPERVAEAAKALNLKHAVVTSVTRDDLPDGGASIFAATIRAIRQVYLKQDPTPALPWKEREQAVVFREQDPTPALPWKEREQAVVFREQDPTPALPWKEREQAAEKCSVEVLIPDFRGSVDALRVVLDAHPDILNHNIETVRRMYPAVRPQADYEQSIELLRRTKKGFGKGVSRNNGLLTKSGIMVGVGESVEEVVQTMSDLRDAGCDILTIGQYLRPSFDHAPIDRYYTPEEFKNLKNVGMNMAFKHIESGPLVRSSYHAARAIKP